MEYKCSSGVTRFSVYLTLAVKVWSTRPLCGPACAAPAQSPGSAAPVCLQAIEWIPTSLGRAAWQRLAVAKEIAVVRPQSGNKGLLPWDE